MDRYKTNGESLPRVMMLTPMFLLELLKLTQSPSLISYNILIYQPTYFLLSFTLNLNVWYHLYYMFRYMTPRTQCLPHWVQKYKAMVRSDLFSIEKSIIRDNKYGNYFDGYFDEIMQVIIQHKDFLVEDRCTNVPRRSPFRFFPTAVGLFVTITWLHVCRVSWQIRLICPTWMKGNVRFNIQIALPDLKWMATCIDSSAVKIVAASFVNRGKLY